MVKKRRRIERDEETGLAVPAKYCTNCGSRMIRDDDGAFWYCPNCEIELKDEEEA